MQFYIVLLLALTYSYATSRRSHTPLVNGPASFRGSETKEPGCLSDTEISDFELGDQTHCGLEFYNSELMCATFSDVIVELIRGGITDQEGRTFNTVYDDYKSRPGIWGPVDTTESLSPLATFFTLKFKLVARGPDVRSKDFGIFRDTDDDNVFYLVVQEQKDTWLHPVIFRVHKGDIKVEILLKMNEYIPSAMAIMSYLIRDI